MRRWFLAAVLGLLGLGMAVAEDGEYVPRADSYHACLGLENVLNTRAEIYSFELFGSLFVITVQDRQAAALILFQGLGPRLTRDTVGDFSVIDNGRVWFMQFARARVLVYEQGEYLPNWPRLACAFRVQEIQGG